MFLETVKTTIGLLGLGVYRVKFHVSVDGQIRNYEEKRKMLQEVIRPVQIDMAECSAEYAREVFETCDTIGEFLPENTRECASLH